MGQLSRKHQLAFLLFNLLYFSMGAGMVGVGVYNLLVLKGFGMFSQTYYLTGAIIFIVTGVLKIVFSLLGILGMFLQWRILLSIYIVVAGFLILPTLAAGVFGLQQFYYVYNEVGAVMGTVFNDSVLFNQTSALRQQFRRNYQCCGIRNGQSDFPSPTPIPPECGIAMQFRLVDNTNVATQIGCQYYITDDIRFHLYYIGAIGLGFGFFELTSALVAMQNVEGHM